MAKKSTYEELEKRVQELEQTESEHKLIEKVQYKKLKLWEKVFSKLPIGMAIFDAVSGQCMFANKSMAQQINANLEQVLSQNFYEIPSWKKSGLLAAANKVLKNNSKQYKEINVTTSFGKHMWAGCHLSCLLLDDKKYLMLTLSDITDRKQVEEILIEERDRTKQYFDVAEVMLLCLDTNQNVLQINKKGCEILEYTEDEIIGKNWFDYFLPKKDIARIKNLFDKFISGEKKGIEYYEKSILTKSGNEKILTWHDSIIKDDSGNVTGILSSGEDITERKQADETVKKNEMKYRLLAEKYLSIFQTVPVSIIITDKNGLMIDINRYHVEHLGKKRVTEKHYLEYKIWEHPSVKAAGPVLQNGYKSVLNGETLNLKNIYLPLTIGGRDRTLNIRGVPLFKNNEVIGSVIINEDVTEHKLAEKLLQRQNDIHQTLMTIAFDCINVPLGKMANAIHSALEKMGELLIADRGYIFKYDFKNSIAVNTHEWCAKGVDPQIEYLQDSPMKDAPEWLNTHFKGEPLIVQDVSALPSGNMKDILESQKIKSLITIPLFQGDELIGFMGFDFMIISRVYSDKEIELVKFLGEILVNMNISAKTEKTLRESEASLREAQQIAKMGNWNLDLHNNKIHLSEELYRIYGFEPGSDPSIEQVRQKIVAEDLSTFDADLQTMNKGNFPKNLEYRIKKSDGGVHHLISWAEVIYDDTGTMVKLVGTVQDITRQKQIENELLALNKTLDEKVRDRTNALKKLNEHLIHTEEKERSAIATDLHDTVTQTLALSVSKLKTIQESNNVTMLPEVQKHIEQSVQEVRQLIHQLCPPVVKDFDIATAIGFLIEEINEKFHADITYINNLDGLIHIAEPKKITLYRVTNELINNILKHSGVKKAKVELSKNKNNVLLEVEDNGIGFDMAIINKNHFNSFGLYSISERCENIGGDVKIESKPGKGTKAVILIPVS